MRKFTDMIVKHYDKEKLLLKRPTLLRKVFGISFYEHPDFGEDVPLVAVLPNGECGLTDLWDVPTQEELEDSFEGEFSGFNPKLSEAIVELDFWENRKSFAENKIKERQLQVSLSEINCAQEERTKDVYLKKMWSELDGVPVNSDNEIEQQFYQFEPGANYKDILNWFDNMHSKGLAHLTAPE